MNTAAKMLEQSHAVHGRLTGLFLGYRSFFVLLLAMLVLISAFIVVYERNIFRSTLAQLQGMEQQQHELALEAKQLLLEQSTWGRQSRVQRIAELELAMYNPSHEVMVLVSS